MIKEIDERLQMLNNENYDGQFLWTNKEEIKKDVIDFFDLDEEEDKEKIEGYLNYDNGEYVYSSLGTGLITLEEALENEFEQAKENIKFYNQDEQEEILSWFYDEVETVNYKFKTIEKEYEESIELNQAKEYLLETSMKELREELEELQNKGYIIDFVEDTMRFNLTGDRDIAETYFIVCKTDYKQIQEKIKIYRQYSGVNNEPYYFTFNKNDINYVNRYPLEMPLTKENIALAILDNQVIKTINGDFYGISQEFSSKTQLMKLKKDELLKILEECYEVFLQVQEINKHTNIRE